MLEDFLMLYLVEGCAKLVAVLDQLKFRLGEGLEKVGCDWLHERSELVCRPLGLGDHFLVGIEAGNNIGIEVRGCESCLVGLSQIHSMVTDHTVGIV